MTTESKKRLLQWTTYGIMTVILVLSTVQYLQYIEIAKSTIPIMDYWRWIAEYGEKVLNGTITFADYFSSDLGEHIQPIAMAINFGVLRNSNFDVQPLVEVGAILRVVMGFALILYFVITYKKKQEKNPIVIALSSIALFYSVINYNQWELATEPFNLANVVRVASYYVSFILADRWLAGIDRRTKRMNILTAALLGVYCAFLTLLMGGGYFVGHLVGIGLAFLITLFRQWKKWRTYFLPMAVWCSISFISALAYYIMLKQRGTPVVMGSSDSNALLLFAEGICLFWGSLFIPTQIANQYSNAIVTMVGAFVLVYVVYVLVKYLCKHKNGEGVFPAICVMYALVLSIAITAGRIDHFGISVMGGSRYVVESSIALFGVTWMNCDFICDRKMSLKQRSIPLIGTLAALLLLIYSSDVQMFHAPYMKTHFDAIEEKMLNIDAYSDDDLAGFQAFQVDDIRYCVDFFEKNGLSVFSNTYE